MRSPRTLPPNPSPHRAFGRTPVSRRAIGEGSRASTEKQRTLGRLHPRTEPLVRLHSRGKLDRLPVRSAQVGALPLVLALLEFRGSYAAVFCEQPLERGKHGAKVGLAIVRLGVERFDLRSERLGPTRG